jgi:phospholipid/cholesterol/gamma-HCH transport system ATP-binding protein
VIVSHDVQETFEIADHVVVLANGQVAAQGSPAELMASTDPLIHQFVHALSDGPVPFHYPAPPVRDDYARGAP